MGSGDVDVQVDLDILSMLVEEGDNNLLSIHIDANADDTGDQVICLDVDASLASNIESKDTCSLYLIDGDTCGQSDLNCDYVKYAKAAEKSLQDGTCPDQGFTVQTGTQTKTYPVIGDIVITTYSKGLAAADTCSLYQIADDQCGQSALNCDYVKYAKAAEKGLADGTCADHGYSVKTGTQTKSYPVIGDIVITTYSKGALQVA